MSRIHHVVSKLGSLAAIALAGASAAACAHGRGVVATPPATPSAAAGSAREASRSSPTPRDQGRVTIAGDILRACGIDAPDAFFDFDSAAIASADSSPLDAVARCFTTGALAGRAMNLVGRADPRGESEYNLVLGESRADAVSAYLVGRGVGRANVRTTSRGEFDSTGRDEEGWARDRRVDVLLAN